jgi:hypothetical protein
LGGHGSAWGGISVDFGWGAGWDAPRSQGRK